MECLRAVCSLIGIIPAMIRNILRIGCGLGLVFVLFSNHVRAADDDVVQPGDNMVVEGVPPIPRQLADEVDRYTEFRAAGLASWHPQRREMLIATRFADTAQAHLVKFPGGARTQLTFFKEPVSGISFQPTQGDYFVFGKDIGGSEKFQKYRYDLSSGEVTMLTDGKSRNTASVWSHAGDRMVYSSTRRNGRDLDLWVMNPADPKSDRMLAELSGNGWDPVDFSPDDKQLLVSEEISINESYLWLMDAQSGAKTLLTPKGEGQKVAYGGAAFSRDGKGVYVSTDRESEFQRLAYVDLETKQYHYLTDDIKWDVESFEQSWDGKTIALVSDEDGVGVLHLIDVASGKERPGPQLPAGVVHSINWHKNNRDLGFVFTSAKGASDAYSMDIETGKVERWTFSETGGINTDGFADAQVVKWNSFDGKSISGLLYKPPAKFTGKRPVMIMIHGGPEGQSRPGFRGAQNYFTNEMGIAVIEPNVRGSTGYGKTFSTLDNGMLREDSHKDIGALLDWIETRDDLDPQRVMVIGGSYGGYMVLAVATNYPQRIRCAIDIVGPSNLATFLKNTSAYRQDLRRVEYGDERDPKMMEFLQRTAPLNKADKISKPLFVVQGGNDPRVPLSEAEQIVKKARTNGTPVWYLMAKDEGHGFAKKKNRDFLLYAEVQFMRQFLVN
jgi:dipeptidyl aminopeptidase/acylaminoacyl peptidase